jgi:tetratricopeptide (TPR) repeat protein
MEPARLKAALISFCTILLVSCPSEFAQVVASAEEHASQGLRLAQAGKLKEAELELRRAAALDPNNAGYLADLGGILGMERKLKEADLFFGKAARLEPDNQMIRRDLAANEWQLGELRDARKDLERILGQDPGDRGSVLLLGMVEADLKDYPRAAQLLGGLPDLVQQHPQSMAALARCYYHVGETAKAKETLKNLVSHFHEPLAVFLAGEMAEEAGDSGTAIGLYECIRDSYPDTARLAYHLAHAQYLAGRWDDCRQILSQMAGAGFRSSQAFDLLGRCDGKLAQATQSQKAFETAIELNPSSDTNYLDLADMLAHRQSRDAAIEVMESCVKALPRSFGCYEEKGTIEESQHYYKQAVSSFERAVQLSPSSANAEFGLANSLAGLGHRSEADADYSRAIRRNPHRADFYREYAQSLLTEAGRNNTAPERRAAALLDRAIELDSSDAESRLLLGELLLNEGKIRSAVALLRAAARLNPPNARPHYLLWRAYRTLRRPNDAAREMAAFKQLSLKPHEPHAPQN